MRSVFCLGFLSGLMDISSRWESKIMASSERIPGINVFVPSRNFPGQSLYLTADIKTSKLQNAYRTQGVRQRPSLQKMNITSNMWFSLTVLLLAAWACLADVALSEERMKRSVSASRSAPQRSKRMIGGNLAPHIPWQAMVYLSDNVLDGGYAGGALISDRWVLTAGRNLFVNKSRQDNQGKGPVIPKVYLGITKKADANPTNEVSVEKVVLHPGFQNRSDWDNDLALIQLKKAVVMSDKVTPIPLPERDQGLENTMGQSGVITGWGWGRSLTSATSLKHLVLPLAGHSFCKAEYSRIPFTPDVDDNMFCTGPASFERNVCFGDAGGALAVTDPETGDVYAAGILSYDKCCSRYNYGVYMKISSYLPWINRVIRGDTENSSALRTDAMSKIYSQQQ